MAWRNRRRRRGVVRDVALRLGFVAPALAKLQMTVVRDLRAWLPGVEGVLLCEFHLQWYWSVLLGGLTFGVGAAFNEDCSRSTLQRLADSELSMLVTAQTK